MKYEPLVHFIHDMENGRFFGIGDNPNPDKCHWLCHLGSFGSSSGMLVFASEAKAREYAAEHNVSVAP